MVTSCNSGRYAPHLIIPLRKEIAQFRATMVQCGFLDDLVPHMLDTHMCALCEQHDAVNACKAELEMLMDDLGYKPSMAFWTQFRNASMNVLNALFRELVDAGAFADNGFCPYVYQQLIDYDVVLVRHDLYLT